MRVNKRAAPTDPDGFIAEMPKAELHVHLEATLQPSTATTDPARFSASMCESELRLALLQEFDTWTCSHDTLNRDPRPHPIS